MVGRAADATIHTVSIDTVAVGRLAADHLLALGHRQIGLLNGREDLHFWADRHDGHRLAYEAAGLVPDAAVTCWLPFREHAG